MPLFFGNQLLSGANASDNQEQLFLLGAHTQEEGVETYSQKQVYTQGGVLYSEGKKVATEEYADKKLSKEDAPYYYVEEEVIKESPSASYSGDVVLLFSEEPPIFNLEERKYVFNGTSETITVSEFEDPDTFVTVGAYYGLIEGNSGNYYKRETTIEEISAETLTVTRFYKITPVIIEVVETKDKHLYIKNLHSDSVKAEVVEDKSGNILSNKMDKVDGTSEQLISFDAEGNPVAVDKSSALENYLPLTGGKLTGDLTIYDKSIDFTYFNETSAPPGEWSTGKLTSIGPSIDLDYGTDDNTFITVTGEKGILSTVKFYAHGFDARNKSINAVAAPTYKYDAVNKEYVDIRVPAWTEDDEGKFLRIVNGTPAWVSIPNAEEAAF